MKSLIKTRLVRLNKATICAAVVLSLAFTANSFAVPTLTTFLLDANTPATGSLLVSQDLTTPFGDISFVGEIKVGVGDPDFAAVGASGGTFDILGPNDDPAQTAELFFDFDVTSLEFIYGGNNGDILIEARDKDGGVVDSFYQDDTDDGEAAGPIILSGTGIRSLYWTDTVSFTGYAPLDNIEVTVGAVIPSPSAVILAGIGVSFVGWLRKRKIV